MLKSALFFQILFNNPYGFVAFPNLLSLDYKNHFIFSMNTLIKYLSPLYYLSFWHLVLICLCFFVDLYIHFSLI